jgi:hypothetical protein
MVLGTRWCRRKNSTYIGAITVQKLGTTYFPIRSLCPSPPYFSSLARLPYPELDGPSTAALDAAALDVAYAPEGVWGFTAGKFYRFTASARVINKTLENCRLNLSIYFGRSFEIEGQEDNQAAKAYCEV